MNAVHIVVAMKPVEAYADNALERGVAGLNIDAARIGNGKDKIGGGCAGTNNLHDGGITERAPVDTTVGRWPANVVLENLVAPILDEQSGVSKSTGGKTMSTLGGDRTYGSFAGDRLGQNSGGLGDEGGASRYFKECKA